MKKAIAVILTVALIALSGCVTRSTTTETRDYSPLEWMLGGADSFGK